MIISLISNGGFTLSDEGFGENLEIFLPPDHTKRVICFPEKDFLVPACLSLSNKDGFVCRGPSLITEITAESYVVEPLFLSAAPRNSGKTLCADRTTSLGIAHEAALFLDGERRLVLECSKESAVFTLPDDLQNPRLFLRSTGFGAVSVVYGEVSPGKNFLHVAAFTDKYAEVFRGTGDSFAFENDSFTVTESFADTLCRTRISTYTFRGTSLEKTKEEFEYKAFKRYPPEKLPLLFVEALKANDTEKLARYVSTTLTDSLPYLAEYVGEFTEISREYSTETRIAVVTPYENRRRKLKYVDFELTDGKISNFSVE